MTNEEGNSLCKGDLVVAVRSWADDNVNSQWFKKGDIFPIIDIRYNGFTMKSKKGSEGWFTFYYIRKATAEEIYKFAQNKNNMKNQIGKMNTDNDDRVIASGYAMMGCDPYKKQLPSKWCIKITEESRPFITEYNNNVLSFCYSFDYLKSDGDIGDWSIREPNEKYPELTLDDFKRLVLNKDPKQELLEEAKRRYPVGTKFYVAHLDYKTDDEVTTRKEGEELTFERDCSDDDTIILKQHKAICHNDSGWTKCVYKNGKWAEKINDMKIIGYNLIKPECEQAYLKLCVPTGCQPGRQQGKKADVTNPENIERLRKAGVLDLWFEAVLEQEFKAGDWVYDINNKFSNIRNRCLPISKIVDGKVWGKDFEGESNLPYEEFIKYYRKATEEEIKAAKIQLPTINSYKGEYKDGMIVYGSNCAKFSVRWFKALWSIMSLPQDDSHTNREVVEVKLNTGVTINREQVEQVIKYINHNNL